jgi:hypothetical protein
LGVDLFYALTGRRLVKADPDKKTIIDCITGEDLIDKETGLINNSRYESLLDNSIRTLPEYAKRFSRFIKRSMTSEDSCRYKNIDDAIKDFNEAVKPSFWEKTKSKWKTAAAITFFALSAGGAAFALNQHYNDKEIERIVRESERFEIRSDWKLLDIISNYVELDVTLSEKDYRKSYPKENVLFGERGDTLQGRIIARGLPPEKRPVALEGKAYIEGYEGERFSTWTVNTDSEKDSCEFAVDRSVDLKIPADIKDGVYIIAVELYAPDGSKADKWENEALQKMKFDKDKIICRKRIPLVIGNIEKDKILDISNISFYNFRQEICVSRADREEYAKDVNKNLIYEIFIPEMNYKKTFDGKDNYCGNVVYTGDLDLAKGTDTKEMMLQLTIRDKDKNNELLAYRFVPLKRVLVKGCKGNDWYEYWWEFPMPSKDFSEKCIEYRKKLDNEPK